MAAGTHLEILVMTLAIVNIAMERVLCKLEVQARPSAWKFAHVGVPCRYVMVRSKWYVYRSYSVVVPST